MSGLHLVVWIDVIIHAQIAKGRSISSGLFVFDEALFNAKDAEVFAEERKGKLGLCALCVKSGL